MNKLYIMCGLPGSGKSTVAEYLHKTMGMKVCSYDDVASTSFGLKSDEVYSMWIDEIITKLLNGEDVVADNTNLTISARQNLLEHFKDINCKKILIAMNTPYEVCLVRNAGRSPRLPDAIISESAKIYQFPKSNESGWDEILMCCEKE